MSAVTLNAAQLREVERHAMALPPHERDSYRHAVACRLRGRPSDLAVTAACNSVMSARPAFMLATDSTETKGAVEP
jgi:hypothetical protein